MKFYLFGVPDSKNIKFVIDDDVTRLWIEDNFIRILNKKYFLLQKF